MTRATEGEAGDAAEGEGSPPARFALLVAVGFRGLLAVGGLLWQASDERGPSLAFPPPIPGHVHGLGVNPADRWLFIATHAYRVAEGGAEF